MDLTLLIGGIILLVVLWPILLPAREAAVIKAQQLEKLAIRDDLKFDAKFAKQMSKIDQEIDELTEVITVKELRAKLAGKTKKVA
jgi:hypothetical protein